MRNDARDELEHIPSLKPDRDDLDGFPDFPSEPLVRGGEQPVYVQPLAVGAPVQSRGAGNGFLWALVLALLIALAGLGWWSYQQISLMNMQLVATQDSFAQISEEAAGRIQDISGKVVATESSVTSESESLKLRIKQLETSLASLTNQQQGWVALQKTRDGQLESLGTDLKAQRAASAEVDSRLKALADAQASLKSEQAALKASQGDVKEANAAVARLDSRVKALSSEVETLARNGGQNLEVRALQQDLLVLRTQLENRPSQSGSTEEFDAFRAQVSRNINTLQAQVQNLQQQLDAR
jgi:chromosome segregation ATPase